jgi:hypothetical protein
MEITLLNPPSCFSSRMSRRDNKVIEIRMNNMKPSEPLGDLAMSQNGLEVIVPIVTRDGPLESLEALPQGLFTRKP